MQEYLVNIAECQLSHHSHWCCKPATQGWVGGPQASARISRKCEAGWGEWALTFFEVMCTLCAICWQQVHSDPTSTHLIILQISKMEGFTGWRLWDTMHILLKPKSPSYHVKRKLGLTACLSWCLALWSSVSPFSVTITKCLKLSKYQEKRSIYITVLETPRRNIITLTLVWGTRLYCITTDGRTCERERSHSKTRNKVGPPRTSASEGMPPKIQTLTHP